MLIDERRQHMLAKIQRDGRVLVSELSDALGISRITIRKDLGYLKSKGKRHGVLARCRLPRATRS
jgi:DeoR family transcriptional regulator of aga operon